MIRCPPPVRQSANLEMVAVDGDIVGVNGDGVATGDGGRQVPAQAPGALSADGGGQRVDKAGAVFIAAGMCCAGCGEQAAEDEKQDE